MTDFHVLSGAGATLSHPEVKTISVSDVFSALRRGVADFAERPSHLVFLCLIYPVAGFVLGTAASGHNAWPLIFPLISGFALVGPIAAIGLYEMSRIREKGGNPTWRDALAVRRSPALPSIVALGVMLFVVFVVWLLIAEALYVHLFGAEPPASARAFLDAVFTTRRGLTLMVLGNVVGLAFAAYVLLTTVIAFPLLLDRDVGALSAMDASARAVARNPVPMVLWGVIVAVLLVIGSIPLLAGLAVVMPILGHATWHLYRAVMPAE